MPKDFKNFDTDKTVNREYDERTYYARAFRQVPEFNGKDKNIEGAEDLDVFDYEFSASSFPDALGQWIAHEVQVAVATGISSFVGFIEKVLNDVVDINDEGHEFLLSYIPNELQETFSEMCEASIKADRQDTIAMPMGFIQNVMHRARDLWDEHNNYWFAHEPELVMFGNPNILGSMDVTGATTSDVADEGIDAMEQFLKNKMEEEE